MDDLLGRQIPHSVDAEQAVLGSMLIDERCVSDVTGIVRADNFYIEINKSIFETIHSMFSYGKPIDGVTVIDRMREDGRFTDALPGYVRELMLITPTHTNAKAYAKIVRDKALLRAIMDAGNTIAQLAISGEGEASDILTAAEKKVYELRTDSNRTDLEHIETIMRKVYKRISDTALSGVGLPGLTTGFPDLDKIILGLNKADLIIIASRPGMGKTSFALNIALHVAKKSGKSVAMFSLEMSKEELGLRLLSSQSYIDNGRLQTGRIKSDADWNLLWDASKQIAKAQLLVNDNPSLTMTEVNAQCRRIDNLGLVVIDYLQLMSVASSERGYRGENRVAIVTEISRMMKVMAKELDVPVICMSQFNRESAKKKERPQLSDLRESGSIEQDADIVLALHREDYYGNSEEMEVAYDAECLILKNRRGEMGGYVPLRWNPQYTSYTSAERDYGDE